MSNQLTYPGDRRAFDPDQILGPDIFGAYYMTTAADYDADTDKTTLTLRPIPPAELQELGEQKRSRISAVIRLRRLFGVPA